MRLILHAGLAAAGCMMAQAAAAQSATSEVPDDLYQFALAKGVAEQVAIGCDALDFDKVAEGREVTLIDRDLRRRGFSDVELRAMVQNVQDERVRLRQELPRKLGELGIRNGDPGSYCQAGSVEISKKTMIGRLLKAAK